MPESVIRISILRHIAPDKGPHFLRTEVDVEIEFLVLPAFGATGRLVVRAVRLPGEMLLELLETQVPSLEAVRVVLAPDLLRTFPFAVAEQLDEIEGGGRLGHALLRDLVGFLLGAHGNDFADARVEHRQRASMGILRARYARHRLAGAGNGQVGQNDPRQKFLRHQRVRVLARRKRGHTVERLDLGFAVGKNHPRIRQEPDLPCMLTRVGRIRPNRGVGTRHYRCHRMLA